jgi:hypothetical protein
MAHVYGGILIQEKQPIRVVKQAELYFNRCYIPKEINLQSFVPHTRIVEFQE